jgi:hypothetical protein
MQLVWDGQKVRGAMFGELVWKKLFGLMEVPFRDDSIFAE